MDPFVGRLLDGDEVVADPIRGEFGLSPGAGRAYYHGHFRMSAFKAMQTANLHRTYRLEIAEGPNLQITIIGLHPTADAMTSVVQFESAK